MCIMVISVTNGALMVSPQLRVISMSRRTLGILCKGIFFVVVRRVGFFSTSLRLVVSLAHNPFSSYLSLLVIGGGLIREVMLV